MKPEYKLPKNIVPQRTTSTGQILAGISGYSEPVAATPLINENKNPILEHELRYIIKSELVPPLATGSETHKENGGDRMDESTKMMIERLERDSREREERYHQDAHEREARYRAEMKEREERIVNIIGELKKDIKEDFRSFDGKLDKMETKIDGAYKHISALTITTILAIAAIAVAVWLK